MPNTSYRVLALKTRRTCSICSGVHGFSSACSLLLLLPAGARRRLLGECGPCPDGADLAPLAFFRIFSAASLGKSRKLFFDNRIARSISPSASALLARAAHFSASSRFPSISRYAFTTEKPSSKKNTIKQCRKTLQRGTASKPSNPFRQPDTSRPTQTNNNGPQSGHLSKFLTWKSTCLTTKTGKIASLKTFLCPYEYSQLMFFKPLISSTLLLFLPFAPQGPSTLTPKRSAAMCFPKRLYRPQIY
mmetsp:Transcript_7290/g.32329  ORF Transcript_7290/g.32329 Transcript_7290/m.32329 type:complete len:246 (-) Transcript_7290:465-1202(-)